MFSHSYTSYSSKPNTSSCNDKISEDTRCLLLYQARMMVTVLRDGVRSAVTSTTGYSIIIITCTHVCMLVCVCVCVCVCVHVACSPARVSLCRQVSDGALDVGLKRPLVERLESLALAHASTTPSSAITCGVKSVMVSLKCTWNNDVRNKYDGDHQGSEKCDGQSQMHLE